MRGVVQLDKQQLVKGTVVGCCHCYTVSGCQQYVMNTSYLMHTQVIT